MSARTLLDPRVADRLARLLAMAGSDHDGEVCNAARMADQLVRAQGLTWGDVIRVPASTTANADWQRWLAGAKRIISNSMPRNLISFGPC